MVLGHLNINSLRNKFEALKEIIKGNLDVAVFTETKLDQSFPPQQFSIEGYALPFRLDQTRNRGGILIYVRENILCREVRYFNTNDNVFEGICLELNFRKSKWLLFGGYNPSKNDIDAFLDTLSPILDHHMTKYENFILLGDFNSEIKENSMSDFCELYNFKNLISGPTCFKSVANPSSIDVILTNKSRSFQNSAILETGLSDHHKMVITVMRSFFPKQDPIVIKYRDYKKFDTLAFKMELKNRLENMNENALYQVFESIFIELLNKHAPMKQKCVRSNNAPFMNKIFSKAIMNRSRLKNRYLRNPNIVNKVNFTKQRNFCLNLLRREKKEILCKFRSE